MPVELLSAKGLWLLALIPPLILLYVLKIRRERKVVASTWLWGAAARDLLAKSPFRRLILQVPLLLQLLALALLALALARPATRGGVIVGDHVAIVVDTSASMNARMADGRSRIEAAREAAKHVVAALAPGSDAMVVEAGRDARIASPLDRDARRLEAAIERLTAEDAEGDLGRAVALASDRLRQLSGDKRLVVVTDGALAKKDSLATASLPLDVVRVGEPLDNLAVTRIDVRSGVDPVGKREQVQAFALVVNFGAHKREAFVTLSERNQSEPLASRKISLDPGERVPVVLTFEPTRGDVGAGLVVELSPGDALAVDDRGFGRVPAGRKMPVVMAPKDGSPWLARALAADPEVDLMGSTLEGLSSAGVPEDALVVVEGACPPVLPGADFVILNPPAGRCRSAIVGAELDRPQITSWSEGDARLRFLALDGVDLARARALTVDGPADSLVRAREGTVISDVSSPGRSGTLLSFDVGDSNWPLKASFVLFARNLVELARTHRASGITGPARTGEPLRVRVPPDVTTVSVEGPEGKPFDLPARGGLVVVPEVARAGFHHLSWQGARPGSVLIAANLTSDAESDLRPTDLAPGSQPVQVSSGSQIAQAHTDWAWLLGALALVLLVLDAWWLTRRPRIAASAAPGKPRLPDRPRRDTGKSPRREAA